MDGGRSVLQDRLESSNKHLFPFRQVEGGTSGLQPSDSMKTSIPAYNFDHLKPLLTSETLKQLLSYGTEAKGYSIFSHIFPQGYPLIPLANGPLESEKTIKSRDKSDGTKASSRHAFGDTSSKLETLKKSPAHLTDPHHDLNLAKAIKELYCDEFGLDVVLLADGGHVSAHCAILAAASPFLKALLLDTNDHPAFISVTGTSLAILKALISFLYTGLVGRSTNIISLCEAATLLHMTSIAKILRKMNSDLKEEKVDSSLLHQEVECKPSSSHSEARPDKPVKKEKSSRLDQILYQKLNVDHLAPEIGDAIEESRVFGGSFDHKGILGELLKKTDLTRSALSVPSYLDAGRTPLAPLNLSTTKRAETLSSSEGSSGTSACSYSASSSLMKGPSSVAALDVLPKHSLSSASLTSEALHSSFTASVPQASSLSSLAPGMNSILCNLPSATLTTLMNSPAFVTNATTNVATSSFLSQPIMSVTSKSEAASSSSSSHAHGANKAKSKQSNGTSGAKNSSQSRKTTVSTSTDGDAIMSSLPLLYTLKSGPLTPEMAKEVYEQLRQNPHFSSFAGLGSLSSIAPGVPTIPAFSYLATAVPSSASLLSSQQSNLGVKSEETAAATATATATAPLDGPLAANEEYGEPSKTADEGALNLSHSSLKSESEKADQQTDEKHKPPAASLSEPESSEATAAQEADLGRGECAFPGNCASSASLPGSTSPELKATALTLPPHGTFKEEGTLEQAEEKHLQEAHTSALSLGSASTLSVAMSVDAAHQNQVQVESSLQVQLDDGVDSPNSVEILDEASESLIVHPIKVVYHSGPTGRKRKGCGDCTGCQVVEDCGHCRFCRDKAKFGGPNRLKQVCVNKRCFHIESEPEDYRKRKKISKKHMPRCKACDGCQRSTDCGECYACLYNAATIPPGRKKVCEMRLCEQQQMEEVRAALNTVGEPSPYSTDSIISESLTGSGSTSPTVDFGLGEKRSHKKSKKPYNRVRTKYYCGECPGCQTTVPCGGCLYCEDMPKFGGPGRYRQKCVKQLCVYHPRLQALKLSNRAKVPLDEHFSFMEAAIAQSRHTPPMKDPCDREDGACSERGSPQSCDEPDYDEDNQEEHALEMAARRLRAGGDDEPEEGHDPSPEEIMRPAASPSPDASAILDTQESLGGPVQEYEDDEDSNCASLEVTPASSHHLHAGKSKGRNKGRSRGKMKASKSHKNSKKSRKRRGPRFTIDPEDHSDFEEHSVNEGEDVSEAESTSVDRDAGNCGFPPEIIRRRKPALTAEAVVQQEHDSCSEHDEDAKLQFRLRKEPGKEGEVYSIHGQWEVREESCAEK